MKTLVAVASLTLLFPGVLSAQGGDGPAVTPAPQTPAAPSPQPSGKTPPTPLPARAPETGPTGVAAEAIKPTEGFAADPGQPQPADPPAIRTLAEALDVAFRRSPNVRLATEQAIRTNAAVDQILALRRPQIGASASYTRLSGSNAAGAAGGFGGANIQNPFPVGLNIQPPGSIPITLSGGAGSGAGGGTGSAGAVSSGSAGQSGAFSSSGSGGGRASSLAASRQTDGGGGNNGGGSFGNGIELNQIGARVSVSQLIDITGIVRTAVAIGELQEALTRLELARTRQELALDVRTGYYNVLRTQGFVRVNEAAVAQSEELLRVTQLQLENQVASQFDVLRARTQLENNRQALISSRNQVAIAKNAFANLLGIDPSTPIEPEAPGDAVVPPLDEEPLIARAISQRPEYLEADINILKARKNVRLARRGLEPSLSASLGGTFNGTSGVPGDERAAAAIGLTLSQPLYDGGQTRAAVEGARSDERGALIQKDQFVRGIKAEVQQARIAVLDAQERTASAELNVTQAREALRLADVRLREGIGTQLEINDAQSALTLAETNAVNARYDLLSALARLSRAVGNPE